MLYFSNVGFFCFCFCFFILKPDNILGFKEDETEEMDYEDIDINMILSLLDGDKTMHGFGVWLMFTYGECKNMRSTNQYCNLVMIVLHYLDHDKKR